MRRFGAARFLLGVLLAVAWAGSLSQTARGIPPSEAAKPILDGIGRLRSLSDTERVGATKDLAMQIRALPAGREKLGLASALTHLSTEGDFGRDTLQAVTDTLAQAVQEAPPAQQNGKPAGPYMDLAQLARYEHMTVNLTSPDYTSALAAVDAIDAVRAGADFTLTDLNGKTWTRSALKGKVVVVNFWATWCPPCRKEMPDLDALYQRFKDQGLVILAISDEASTTVKPFIDEHKYSYPILLDPGRRVNTAYQIDSIPKSFVYNRGGKMVAESIDMRTQGQFLEMLAQAGLK